MHILVAWFALGAWGALIQHEWYIHRRIRHDHPWLDLLLNTQLGPIGLIACYIAYGDKRG